MKFNLGSINVFRLDCNNGLEYFEKKEIIAVSGGGITLQVRGSPSAYHRKKVHNKYIYIRGEDAHKLVVNTVASIYSPGSTLKLWHNEYYAVPVKPEEDEWSLQDVQELFNTFELRNKLQVAQKANNELKELIASRAVTVLVRRSTHGQLLKQEKPLTTVLSAIGSLLEETASNF